jgi:hypothetical protein
MDIVLILKHFMRTRRNTPMVEVFCQHGLAVQGYPSVTNCLIVAASSTFSFSRLSGLHSGSRGAFNFGKLPPILAIGPPHACL